MLFVEDDFVLHVDSKIGRSVGAASCAVNDSPTECDFFDTAPDNADGYFVDETMPPFSHAWAGFWGTDANSFPSGLVAIGSNGVVPGNFILNYAGHVNGPVKQTVCNLVYYMARPISTLCTCLPRSPVYVCRAPIAEIVIHHISRGIALR